MHYRCFSSTLKIMKNIEKKQVYSGIGGQAVIEGIMMKNGQRYSVAVRKPDGTIEVKEDSYVSMTEKHKICALPLIRGVFSFADSMILGMKTLTYSASFFEDDEGSEPSRLELWLEKTFGDRLEKILMTAVMVVSFALAIFLFMLLPVWLAGFLRHLTQSEFAIALLEGVLRVAIFILYILLISRTEDIRRTFQYHGAEHKCINCVEHGLPLTVENVRKSSKEHKRCGTSFLVYVMLISILLFMVVRVDGIALRFLSRILLIPVIAGISYELLRIAGRSSSGIVRLFSIPGMWMQGLTTKEPEDDQIEVAIAAVERVFDWKQFEQEQFPEQAGEQI